MNPPPEQIGPYKIQRFIDKGGFGVVYEGIDEQLGRRVAVKMLRADKSHDKETVARFIREANALLALKSHRGVVNVYDADKTSEGIPYLAMEFLEGQTLREWLDAQTDSVPLTHALAIAEEIAATMVDVHDRQLVHRDLKPENIMLVHDDQAPFGVRPILLDFGIAKLSAQMPFDDQALTQIKTKGIGVVGTPAYMAPEQMSDADNVDIRADVYTLGLVVYELLAGKLPFASNLTTERVRMRERGELVHLHDVMPSISPLFAAFVMAMLAQRPEDRPTMRDCRRMFARDWTQEVDECPFPGLQAFQDHHAHLFFGRQTETQFILEKLEEIRTGKQHRWLQIQGPGGTGKSSLVHAGVLPRLLQSKDWFVITMRMTEDPGGDLASVLARAYGQNKNDVVKAFDENPRALHVFLKEHHASKTNVLLVMDAFENLFTSRDSATHKFQKLVACALENAESPLRLLTMMRSDDGHRFESAPDLAKLRDAYAVQYDLPLMNESHLFAVVEAMTHCGGLRLDEGLAQKIVHDTSNHALRLSLVGQALRRLWLLRGGAAIKREHYDDMGGVGGSLTDEVAKLLAKLGREETERAKWMVLDLVQIGSGAPDTRRTRTRADVLRAAGDDAVAEKAWKHLSGERKTSDDNGVFRLLVVSGEAQDPDRTVELLHDVVVRKVPIIVEWMRMERPFLELIASLERAATEWHRAGVDKPWDGLPTKTLLDHYRGGKDPAKRERLWRMASAEAREYLQAAMRLDCRQKLMRIGLGAFVFAAMVVIGVSAQIARDQKRAAENALQAFQSVHKNIVDNLDWELSWRPNTAELRQSTLADLDSKLANLEKAHPSTWRRSVVDMKHRRSEFVRGHESLETSYEFLLDARRRIDAGLERDPADPETHELLGMYHSKHGKLLLAEEKFDGAFGDFKESVKLFEAAKKEDPQFDEQMLATSWLELGDAEVMRDHYKEASMWYDQAIASREKKAQSDNDSYWRAMVADATLHKARALSRAGDVKEARHLLDNTHQILLPLVRRESFNVYFSFLYAQTDNALATADLAQGQWNSAIEHATNARGIGERIREGDPKHKDYTLLLVETLDRLQMAANQLGETTLEQESRAKCNQLRREFVQQDPRDLRVKPFTCTTR